MTNLYTTNVVAFSVVFCDKPSEGVNTEVVPPTLNGGLSYLEIYTYSCLAGYETTDELSTVCKPDGTLSLATPPTCHGK